VQLLLDDGKVRLEVETCSSDQAMTRVLVGGVLSDRKGVSVVGAVLPLSALTPKDRIDLAYGLELGADWIALSFVQRPEDVEEVRAIVAGRAGVMSKLEKPSAVEHLDAIVALSDAVMVARGDLGVEMAPEQVPPVQRQIVRACRHAGKPSIVATQMLESMIDVPTPTRAEASDVASAIYHGADAVMLSAESASGKFPFEAVTMMPHHQGRGERSRVLPADERCGASSPRRNGSRRDLRQHAARHRPDADRRRRHLHNVGVEQSARIPRAAGDLDPQHGCERWYGTTPHTRLGHSFG
jgi:pyruvate kinase